jgi:hypothetical protein
LITFILEDNAAFLLSGSRSFNYLVMERSSMTPDDTPTETVTATHSQMICATHPAAFSRPLAASVASKRTVVLRTGDRKGTNAGFVGTGKGLVTRGLSITKQHEGTRVPTMASALANTKFAQGTEVLTRSSALANTEYADGSGIRNTLSLQKSIEGQSVKLKISLRMDPAAPDEQGGPHGVSRPFPGRGTDLGRPKHSRSRQRHVQRTGGSEPERTSDERRSG